MTMDSQLVQRTRYQLQARIRTAKTCPTPLFPGACKHLIDWVDGHPLLRHVLDPLRDMAAQYEARIASDQAKVGTPQTKEITGPWDTPTRENLVALSVAALRKIASADLSPRNTRPAHIIAFVLAGCQEDKPAEIVEALRDVAVQNLYDYLDEQIDARNAVLGLLLKYKTRCEWYRRNRLRAAAADGLEGRTGERALAFDLYEYLHDQGVDFAIESATASGEPDLLSSDVGAQPLVADAKYVKDDEKLVETLAAGFRQVQQYCRDKNEPVGYLVVFLDCTATPEIMGERDDGFPCFRLGGITVYYVVIDIRGRTNTASKLPKPRVVQIDRTRLVSMIEDHAPGGALAPT